MLIAPQDMTPEDLATDSSHDSSDGIDALMNLGDSETSSVLQMQNATDSGGYSSSVASSSSKWWDIFPSPENICGND
jgi:hypothetical protein